MGKIRNSKLYLTSIYSLLVILLYLYIAYFLERTAFIQLAFSFLLVFFFTYQIIKTQYGNWQFLVGLGVLFRLLFLFGIPNLSQDFYRFIWDGHLLIESINPYLYLPNDLILKESTSTPFFRELYQGMGSLSASHYSNYPPLNQFLFYVSSLIGNQSILNSIVIMRLIIILADLGILYFGSRLLTLFKLPKQNIFWYFLNPLVLVELTGNLHFEGVMLFFLLASLLFINQKKYVFSAILIACSISVKLLPLLLLPLFFKYLGWKKSIVFYIIIIASNLLFFFPFLNQELVQNYIETIGLWFTNFEFNASIYYIIREFGFYFKGYNIIQTFGKVTPFVTVGFVLFFSFFKKNSKLSEVIKNMLFVITIYFFISTTVHPWYIINLIVLTVFTRFQYPILWSLTVILSYSAYSSEGFQENYYFIFTEYILVFILLGLELNSNSWLKKNTIFSFQKKLFNE